MALTSQPSPFAAALIAGKNAVQSIKGIRVLYCTDTFEIEIAARVGKTKFRIDNGNQFNQVQRSRDYLVAVTELVDPHSGELFTPAIGHRIKELQHGQLQVFEILPFGDEPHFRDTDTTAHEFRIHTKRVTEEPHE